MFIAGGLGIFSIFSLNNLGITAILTYIGELALNVLLGYRLFYLIGNYSVGLANDSKKSSSQDIEKGTPANGGKTL